VLRASHAVLKKGGILVGYSIHLANPLTAEQSSRASDLGPSFVSGLEDPIGLAKEIGFVDITVKDVTPHFRRTCLTWIQAMMSMEGELRKSLDQGDYEDELQSKSDMLLGIEEGLLKRSLIICRRQ